MLAKKLNTTFLFNYYIVSVRHISKWLTYWQKYIIIRMVLILILLSKRSYVVRFKYILNFAVVTMLLLIVACSNGDGTSSTTVEESSVDSSVGQSKGKLVVLATTPMIGELVKQVAGDSIEVNILMPYVADPHSFEPSPQDVKKIEEADLVFYTGLKYESVNLLKLLQNSVQSQELLI